MRKSLQPTHWGTGETRDIAYHPLFTGVLSRWVWRFVQHRMTRAGRWLVWPTLAFLFLGSISLDLQLYVLLLYLAVLWGVALLLALCLRPRVELEVSHAARICAGETLPVAVRVTQRGRLPGVDLQVQPVRLPPGVEAVPAEGAAVPTLSRDESARVRLGLLGARRGVYTLPGYRVASDFPFGLFNAYRFVAQPRPLLVYPRFTPLASLALPQGWRHHPGGVALPTRQGDSFELLGNREYQEGDPIRDIDWRATARWQTTVVREYTQEYFLRVGVVLDTHVPPGAGAAGAENFERAVSLCAAISDYMARQAYLVDLFAAGPQLYHLTAGQHIGYLEEILDILACVEAHPREPFATLEPEISRALGKITLVLCVFLDWNAARRQFVEHLTMHGVAVKAIVARETPCALDPRADGLPVIGTARFDAGVEAL